MADSSNSSTDSQTEDSQTTTSEDEVTTSGSNENSSGGFDSSALSNDSFNLDSTPDFGIDFGDSNDNKSFGFGENLFSDFDFDNFSDSGSDDYAYNNTSYSNNKSEPTMTVDEVYGNSTETGTSGNQSIVENQGDYAASSNEKSNVETSTPGKQDNITVTPESVTENTGTVKNDTIQSVEGLDFQQKDKESQDVLEAKKSRDEAEAEDKANQMKDSLLANQEYLKSKTDLTADEKNAVNKFQIGNSGFEEQDKAKLNELNQQKQKLDAAKNEEKDAIVAAKEAEDEAKKADKAVEEAQILENRAKQIADRLAEKEAENRFNKGDSLLESLSKFGKSLVSPFTDDKEIKELEEEAKDLAKALGIDAADILGKNTVGDFIPGRKEILLDKVQEKLADTTADRLAVAKDNQQKAQETAKSARAHATEVTTKVQEAQASYDKRQEDYNTWKTEYWAGVEKAKAEEEAAAKAKAPAATPDPKAPATTTPTLSKVDQSTQTALDSIASSTTLSPEQKAQAEQSLTDLKSARQDVEDAASKLTSNLENVKPEDIKTYFEATKQYEKKAEDALKGNPLTKTDYNRTFTKAIVDAIDFKVTLADGTVKDYSDFMMGMATKSPAIAQAMYEAKADRLEKDGHPLLAKIESAMASMSKTWLGSKLTFADNQVRNQFNQMAKTSKRATYATYNNVLNDKTGKYSEDEKAEASAAINRANSLMTASTALKASTGFFSGIGDSMKDGVYGKTDPKTLNAYQKTLNTVDNFAKITLGLGITPGANKAYQNMYYMAGDKVNKSFLFNKDFDGDGFALCQEYGNNAAAGMIAGAGELATGIALIFNPATSVIGLNLTIDSAKTFINGLYGVQKDARKSEKYTQEVLDYFEEAKDIAAETDNEEALDAISSSITQIENFQLKSDEVGNLDNWLEGSGSNTADNGKFNQSLSYDEWLKLIEADPTMREYAKKLIAEKKEK